MLKKTHNTFITSHFYEGWATKRPHHPCQKRGKKKEKNRKKNSLFLHNVGDTICSFGNLADHHKKCEPKEHPSNLSSVHNWAILPKTNRYYVWQPFIIKGLS